MANEAKITELNVPTSNDETARLEHPAAQSVITSECGFLVYMKEDGHWIADNDVNKVMVVGREANGHDMWMATQTIAHDITVLEMAQRSFAFQQQAIGQAIQAAQAQQQAQQLVSKLDIPGITNNRKP